jgi:chitin-binding protein
VSSTLGASPRHAAVTRPPSRADLHLGDWRAHDLEAGKFFPRTEGGLSDPYAPEDVPSAVPPADGQIASAGRSHSAELDEPRTDWQKTAVTSGGTLEFVWEFHKEHKTRRWNYFVTRAGWDPTRPLTRDQFDAEPFHQVQMTGKPYWNHPDLVPVDPTTHTVPLPERSGYHVILAVWEVADTGNAFYQVVDTDFR